MKNESTYAKKFAALYKKIKAQAEPLEPLGAVSQMIFGFLMWEASRKQAENAFKRLDDAMIDHNELRISRQVELIELIGSSYPKLNERIERMKDSLEAVYFREHIVTSVVLESKSKKEIKEFLDDLPGMTPYISAHVRLVVFGSHAIPVDEKLAGLLRSEGAVHPDATIDEITHFLERQFKAGEAAGVHAKLQAWVDAGSKRISSRKTAKKKVAKKAPAKKKVTKKTSASKAKSSPTAAKKTKSNAKKAPAKSAKKTVKKAAAGKTTKKSTKKTRKKKVVKKKASK